MVASQRLTVLFLITTLTLAALAGFGFEFLHAQIMHMEPPVGPFDGIETRHAVFCASIVVAIVFIGSLFKILQIRKKGVADLLVSAGAQKIPLDTKCPHEKRFLNVIEEMSIASGLPVPVALILPRDPSINAFTAGLTPSTACICATDGALKVLSRAELQGVVAHEFSHILHGDVLYNTRIVGVLNGYTMFVELGYHLLRADRETSVGRRGSEGIIIVWSLGLLCSILGYLGLFVSSLFRAAFNRQREWLADASAVQFTRDQSGIRGALQKIDSNLHKKMVNGAVSANFTQMCFVKAVSGFWSSVFASHPPLEQRIRRLGLPDYASPERFQLVDYQSMVQIGQDQSTDLDDLPMQGLVDPLAGPTRVASDQPSQVQANHNRNSVASDKVTFKDAKASIHRNFSVSAAGTVGPDALEAAHKSLLGIPEQLLTLLHTPQKAFAVLVGAVIYRGGSDPVQQLEDARGLKLVDDVFFNFIRDDVFPHLDKLSDNHFFTIVQLVRQPIHQLNPSELMKMIDILCKLVELDHKITWMELCLVIGFCAALADKVDLKHFKAQAAQDVLADISKLIAFVARLASGTDDAHAERGYKIATQELGMTNTMPSGADCKQLAPLLRAVGHVKALSIKGRMRFVQALLACIKSDRQVDENEYLTLRALCTALDCPFPMA